MTKPRLLHVFSTFSPGGPQVRATQLINHFGSQFTHGIVASDGNYEALSLLSPQSSVRVVEEYPPMKGRGLAATLWATGRYLRSSDWTALLTYNWGSIETALANTLWGHKRHIHHEDGFSLEESERRLPKRSLFRRVALQGCNSLIVPSATLATIATNEWKFHPPFLQQIPNGVDIELYRTPPSNTKLGPFTKQPDDIWIGCVSGLRPEKNVRRLVRVASSLLRANTKVKVVICGEGQERNAIEQEAFALGVSSQVFLAGFQSNTHSYMGLFDVHAIPSDTEQFPICMIEAMAAGCAVVGMDVGDVRTILPASHQWCIAAPGDEPSFTAILKRIVGDASLCASLGAANQSHVAEYYSLRSMLDRHLKLWSTPDEPVRG